MITRSAKAMRSEAGKYSLRTDPLGTRARKRKKPASVDLGEELKEPSIQDYNALRKELISKRSQLEMRDAELEKTRRVVIEKDRIFAGRTSELIECTESHVDRIQKLEDELKELKRQAKETREKDDPVEPGPGEEMEPENEDPKKLGEVILERLKSGIHEFATRYFSGRLQKPLVVTPGTGWAAQYLQATTPGEKTYMDYLQSKRRCPMIIKAFIWRFLCGTIFNDAAWAGSEEIRLHVSGLQKILSKFHNRPGSEPEQVGKYRLWKARTTTLVLQLLHAGTVADADHHRIQLERHFAQAISDVVTPFMRSSADKDKHKDSLINIVHEAIDFDKEISRWLPRVTLTFSPGPIQSPFDFSLEQENVMKLHPGEKAAEKLPRGTKTKIFLVVTPGVTTCGLEDGPPESFQEDLWYLPMEVSCVKPKPQRKFPKINGKLAPNVPRNGNSTSETTRTPSPYA